MPGKRPSPLVLTALFLSGAAGLIDQVCWIRLSGLLFGSTTHALSTVLGVFFLGLALGSAVAGRLAGRIRRPLAVAAALELGLGLLVLATPFAFAAVQGLFGQAYRAAGGEGPGLWAARAGLIALVLLPPSFLMGGTLPLFARQLVGDPKRIGASIAALYTINTLGAAAGALATGFLLLPALGLTASLAAAAALNAVAAAFLWSARAPALEPLGPPAPADAAPELRIERAVLAALVFGTGFVALGQEVLWARFLAAVVGNGVHTVSLTIAIVLVGIVIGSSLVARFADRGFARGRSFALLQLASALVTWTLFYLPPAFWRGWGSEAATAAVLMLPAAILAGASFPLAARMAVAQPAWAGTRLGPLLAASTLGGIAGALVIGFYVLPVHGLAAGLVACTAVSLTVAAGAWAILEPASRSPLPRLAVQVVVLGLLVAVPSLTKVRLPDDFLAEPPGRLIAVREGVESNLAVVRGPTGERVLEIDRWWQGQDAKTHQVMAAHLPMLLHPRPERVLLVGVGAGQTPARFVLYPGLVALDCVDIEPRVFDVIRAQFPHAWMDDPRVRLLATDGRNHVLHAAERYDVISLEVGQLFRPGAASFYTVEFYRAARAHLRPDGIVSQFVPLPFLHTAELRGIVATFRTVFPEATLWYNTSELLLIGGGAAPAPTLDSARVAAVLADSAIAADLDFSLWGGPNRRWRRPEVLAAAQLAGPVELFALSAGGRIDHDDRPILAYQTTRPAAGERRELESLPLLRAHLVRLDSPESQVIRDENLAEIAASAFVRDVEALRDRGDLTGVIALLHQAIAHQPGNVRTQRMLGDALLLSGRNAEAESAYVAALSIEPDDARANGGYGLLCLVTGRIEESVAHYRNAFAHATVDDADWRNNYGAALVRQGNLLAALAEFEQAVLLRPSFSDARQNAEATRAEIARRAASAPAPAPAP